MALEYEQDVDLEFLGELSNEDLEALVRVLIKDRDGDPRLTEELTDEARYVALSPDHHAYWDLIAAEFVEFGSHTFGSRKSYREILCNVCDKLKVNYNHSAPIELIEEGLLWRMLTARIEDMTDEELRSLVEELRLPVPAGATATAVAAALQTLIRTGGFQLYKIAVILLFTIAKAFGLVLPFVVYTTLTRTMGIFAGPVGWIGTGLLTAVQLAGPAYRVAVPATITIACLRAKHRHERDDAPDDGPDDPDDDRPEVEEVSCLPADSALPTATERNER